MNLQTMFDTIHRCTCTTGDLKAEPTDYSAALTKEINPVWLLVVGRNMKNVDVLQSLQYTIPYSSRTKKYS